MNPGATIESKPTEYAGVAFRSQLEARWAVYFDSVGLQWLYEPKRFALGYRTYLPDFHFPKCDVWAEVKPMRLTAQENLAVIALAMLTNRPVIKLIGKPNPETYPCQFARKDGRNGILPAIIGEQIRFGRRNELDIPRSCPNFATIMLAARQADRMDFSIPRRSIVIPGRQQPW